MILVIDGNNLCHRANFAIRNTLSFNRKNTSLIFGSLNSINSIVKKFEPENLVICFDSPNSLRKKISPVYKNKLKIKKSKEELHARKEFNRQMVMFKEMISDIGICNIEVDGLEGDDIMALTISNSNDFVVLCTTDNDLLQTLSDRVCIYNFKELITKEDFKEKWDIEPHEWVKVKAIGGCNGDNVIGFRRVGEKTAIKIIKGGKTPHSKKDIEDMINKNTPLVRLPFKEMIIDIKQTKINRVKLFEYRQKYSLKTINHKSWLENF